jgi:hypothetical protein
VCYQPDCQALPPLRGQASRPPAAHMFENHHPHFAIFPGDSVEIMEILPIPGR